jgi:maltose-binding protein MalE
MMRKTCLGFTALAALLLVLGCSKTDKTPAPAPNKKAPAEPAASTKKAPAEPAAPAKKEAPEVTGEVVLWHAYRGQEAKALEKLVASFEKANQKAKVRVLPVPFDAYEDKITVTVPQGNGPDVLIFAHNMIGEWVRRGLLMPLGNHYPPDALTRFLPFTVKALVHRGNLYGLPLAYKSLVMFYRTDKVKKAPETVAELEKIATELTDRSNPDDPSYGWLYPAAALYQHAAWLHVFGGKALGEDDTPQLGSEAFVESARFVKRFTGQDKLIPPAMTDFLIGSLFNKGKAAIVWKGPWFLGELEASVPYAVAPLPTLKDRGPLRPYLGVEALMVSAKAKNVPGAVALIAHLTSDAGARLRLMEGRQPVANAATYEDEEVKKHKLYRLMKVFRVQADQAELMPASPAMQAIWATADTALQRVLFAGADPATAMKEAQAKAAKDVAGMGK